MGNYLNSNANNSDEYDEDTEISIGVIAGVQHLLQRSEPILDALRHYKGCDDYIRRACLEPNNEDLKTEAFTAVSANVQTVMEFYAFSRDLVGIANNISSAMSQMQARPEDLKIFGKLLYFCFEFDRLKACKPSVQNDVSYYRRSLDSNLMRSTVAAVTSRQSSRVTGEVAHLAGLWLADPSPMMNALSGVPSRQLCDLVAVCGHTLQGRGRRLKKEDSQLCLRTWVAAIILFDKIEPSPGAFVKNSPVKVKQAIRFIRRSTDESECANLLNALRYSSTNYGGAGMTKGLYRSFDNESFLKTIFPF